MPKTAPIDNAPCRLAKPRILIADDDRNMLQMLKTVVARKCGAEVAVAESGGQAWELAASFHPDLILTDIKMPGLDGLELLRRSKERDPAAAIILMTGYGSVELAVQALKEGAYDFFEKPFDNEHLVHAVKRSLERTCLLRENQRLQEKLGGEEGFQGFIGQSDRLREVFNLIRRLADTDVTVLIRGQSGTGKELAAQALHALSRRAAHPLVTVNCPALPEPILESELFGHVRGAFTGAAADKKGLFLEADGSSILLDEIGDLPLTLQTKLLRVLQEKELRPLGQTRSIKIDARVISSTNQDLEEKIRTGQFREDLFYRLNVVTVTMPSLAEIPEDIPVLARHFLARYGEKYGHPGLGLTEEAMKNLLRRPWPGNVRELQNVIKRAVLLAAGTRLGPEDLAPAENGKTKAPAANDAGGLLHLSYNEAKQEMVTRFSRDYLAGALERSGGNVTAAARASGLGRQAFQRLLRRFGLASEEYRAGGEE
ncbi:MAG: sigma-54 dependent transcriptional regulator [Desulfobacteraceae bacterium]|nr:sigma-54 dependent transcriptional regulator [Desulfobacteraceae bacterium]